MGKKNRFATSSFFGARVTAVISTSLVLFLLGLLVVMSLVTHELSSYVKENIGFSVILSDDISDLDLKKMERRLNASTFVKSTDYFSKERALHELTQELGENPKEFLGTIPLMASIEVKLNAGYANNDSIKKIEKDLRKNEHVRDVIYRKDLIQMVNDNVNQISLFLGSMALILLLISFVLLSNTIRLHIYSKRFILRTMKLVGATSGFIRRPFVVSNLLNGIVSAFLATGMISGLLYYLSIEIDGLSSLISAGYILITFAAIFALGILLSVVCAYFSLNKFLNMRPERLFSF